MDRSAFNVYAIEIAVFVGIILFLIFFRDKNIYQILNEYGVPLLIYIVIFSAYPMYKILKNDNQDR